MILTKLARLATVLSLSLPALAQSVTLSCKLQDNSPYSASLDGTRSYGMLYGKPTARSADGTLLQVHVRQWDLVDKDTVVCALQVGNTAANPDGSGHPGKIYYSSISIASDWKIVFETNRAAQGYLVEPGQHVFFSGAAFVRRFVLYRNKTADQAKAYLDKVKLTASTEPYFPQRMALPIIDVRAQEKKFGNKLNNLRTALNNRTIDLDDDLRTKALGPFQPVGNNIAYEHGGQGIYFVYGWEQAPSSALFWRQTTDLVIERMRFVYDKKTGARITPEMWAVGAKLPFQNFTLFLHGDSDQKNTEGRHEYLPPAYDVPAFNSGFCAYEQALANYDAYDGAHLVRALGPACAAWWRIHDPVAKELLLDLANWCRFSWCDIGQPPGPYRSGLPTYFSWAKTPNQGVPSLGREFGWVCYANAAALAVGPSKAELAGFTKWGKELLRLESVSAMQSGLTQRASALPYPGISGAWETKASGGGAVPKDRDLAQSFEQPIVSRGTLALGRQLGDIKDGIPAEGSTSRNQQVQIAKRLCTSMYANPVFKGIVPAKYVTVGKYQGPSVLITEGWNLPETPYGDSTHVSAELAEIFRSTGEEKWLDLICGPLTVQDEMNQLLKQIQNPSLGYEPAWDVEALSVLQQQTVTR